MPHSWNQCLRKRLSPDRQEDTILPGTHPRYRSPCPRYPSETARSNQEPQLPHSQDDIASHHPTPPHIHQLPEKCRDVKDIPEAKKASDAEDKPAHHGLQTQPASLWSHRRCIFLPSGQERNQQYSSQSDSIPDNRPFRSA